MILAQAVAINLQLPMVVAVTKAPITSSTGAVVHSSSRAAGGVYEDDQTLYLSAEFVCPGDNVLVIDDVLASGKMATALLELVKACGAAAVGYGFLIEKGYCNGRTALPAEAVIEPVVRIQGISGGNIEFADADLCW